MDLAGFKSKLLQDKNKAIMATSVLLSHYKSCTASFLDSKLKNVKI